MSPDTWAALAFDLLVRLPEFERVPALQSLQRLVQAELARLWGERNESPGHVLRERGADG